MEGFAYPPRQSTQEALDKLTNPNRQAVLTNSPWYTSGIDFWFGKRIMRLSGRPLICSSFYAPAQEACVRSRERLGKLKLRDDELSLLDNFTTSDSITKKLQEIHAEQEKKSKRPAVVQRASKFFEEFCAFADKTSHIVMLLLPQSPEYTVTFGMLSLVFNVCVANLGVLRLR